MSISNNSQNLPETKLLYLNDTYLFESTAILLDVIESENFAGKQILVLDQTIFYPPSFYSAAFFDKNTQGGGQPSDTGLIEGSGRSFEVEKVVFNPNGLVWHIGNFLNGKVEVGEEVNLKINQEKRLINSKNHSSGHLLDWAIESLNLPLKANKGYHFPDGPYVEYAGELEITEDLKSKIETKANEIISQNIAISFVMENGKHESGKPMRIMQVGGFADCPCGGTHIRNSAEIGTIKIRKITKKSGMIKISYLVES